jgi:wyosine [tRNA(Phe)-imidazoG37] synthetase (radical SAM superfamily)
MSAKICLAENVNEVPAPQLETAFGCPRDFLGNRFIYVVISPRARGLSLGVNLSPAKVCNFDCIYCEVNREQPVRGCEFDVSVMATELEKTLLLIQSSALRQINGYQSLGGELLHLRHVAFSGDGEPTLCAKFAEAVQEVVHVRAMRLHPPFKLVLITNGTRLDQRDVQKGLQYFTRDDEIWIKLDAGTQEYMDRVNQSTVPLEKVLENACLIGRKRPIIIQSLFPLISGWEPPEEEIDAYVKRLQDLKERGAMISLVQIYSATRPPAHPNCSHIPLQTLARICRRIKAEVGLKAEVF